jgi:hypothetical protein
MLDALIGNIVERCLACEADSVGTDRIPSANSPTSADDQSPRAWDAP